MRFRVKGANAQTGKEITATVNAATAADAERIARAKGLLVASVEPIHELQPATATPGPSVDDDVMAALAAASAVATATAGAAPPADLIPVDYRGYGDASALSPR